VGNGRMGTEQRHETWDNLLLSWGVAPSEADRTFHGIVQAYADPGRRCETAPAVNNRRD